jgi:hypothetical protein
MVTSADSSYPNMVSYKTDLGPSTASEQSMTLAAEWLDECLQNHEGCIAAFPKAVFQPTRLVMIEYSNDKDTKIKLRKGNELPPDTRYATLSHRWGFSMPFRLTNENLNSCFKTIPFEIISKAFQEAIRFAYRSKLCYIWIDSLCELSDSKPFTSRN